MRAALFLDLRAVFRVFLAVVLFLVLRADFLEALFLAMIYSLVWIRKMHFRTNPRDMRY